MSTKSRRSLVHTKKFERTIQKESIDCARYREFPLNVKTDDFAKNQIALAHMNATLKLIKQVNEKLLARKKKLFDQDLKPKTLASNEITFVQNFATKVEVIIRETEQIFLDVEHVVHQLQKNSTKVMLKAEKEK